MRDVNELMKDLARKRPVFHSEADFQHALAWHIHGVGLDPRVRLERPVEWPRPPERIYIDLWLPSSKVAVELKYRTRRLEHWHEGELFALRDQSAQDTGRYDFLKDVQRLEQLSAPKLPSVQAGYAIMLTNDPLYWEKPPPNGKPTNDAEFRIHEGRTIKGKLEWSPETGPGTKKGREDPICLKGTYTLRWREYSDPGDRADRRFRYLAIQVGCPTTFD